jgi:hypothetical protein
LNEEAKADVGLASLIPAFIFFAIFLLNTAILYEFNLTATFYFA